MSRVLRLLPHEDRRTRCRGSQLYCIGPSKMSKKSSAEPAESADLMLLLMLSQATCQGTNLHHVYVPLLAVHPLADHGVAGDALQTWHESLDSLVVGLRCP